MPGSLCRFGPAKRHRRGPHRPDGIDQDVEARRSGSASWHGRRTTAAPCRRRRAAAAYRHAGSAPSPASSRACRSPPNCQRSTSPSDFGGAPSGSKKCSAVEMVGDRAVIGFHAGDPERRHTDGRGGAGEQSKDAAAGDRHGGIRNGGSGKTWALYGVRAKLELRHELAVETVTYLQNLATANRRLRPNFP